MPNYIPEFSGYSGQGAFRYWCQKVLPLVYDDSLSYYELLNKVVVYLNNTIEDVAKAEGNIDSLLTAYTQLQGFVNDYFDNLDVQEQINTKLDEMASDGTLTTIVRPLIVDEVTEWLNENITIQPESEVVIDASLSIAGAAADAKATGDKILANKKNIDIKLNGYEYLVEQTPIETHNGELWNSTLNSTNEIASGAYCKFEIEEGYYKCETMVFNSAFYRPYAIYGENGLLLKEEDSVAQNERKEFSFYAPEGSEYIYINCRPALLPFLYKVEYDSNSNLLYGNMTVEKTANDIIITLGDNELRIGKRGNNMLPDLKLLKYGDETLIDNTSEGTGGTDWLPPYNIISGNATSQIYPSTHTATTGGNHPFEYPAGVKNITAKNVSFKCYANGKEVTDKIGNVSKLEIEFINDVMVGNTLNVPEQGVYPEGTFYLREYYLLTITPCFEIDVLHYFVPNYDGEIIWRSVLQIANLQNMNTIGNYKIYIDKYTDRPLNLNEIVTYAVSDKPKKVFIENNKYLEALEIEQDFGVLDKVTNANIQSGSSTNKLYAIFINSYGSTPAIFKTNRYNIYANNKYWFHGKYRFIKK